MHTILNLMKAYPVEEILNQKAQSFRSSYFRFPIFFSLMVNVTPVR